MWGFNFTPYTIALSLLFFTIFLALWIFAVLLYNRGVDSRYCRKFLQITCSTVAIALYFVPFEIIALILLYGSILIAYVSWRGESSLLFKSVIRSEEITYAKVYVMFPLITAVLGLILAWLIFEKYYQFGILILGWSDSSGELVGARYGKHKFYVPTITGAKSPKSVEGCLAVFLTSIPALVFSSLIFSQEALPLILPKLIAISALVTLCEAFSPRGLDNLTLTLLTPLFANLILA